MFSSRGPSSALSSAHLVSRETRTPRQDPAFTTLQGALEREILRSERQRATLLAGIFALVILSFGVSLIFLPEGSPLVPRGVRPVVVGMAFLGLTYGLVLRRVIGRRIASGTPPSPILRCLGVAVETSLPTLVIVVTSQFLTPISALLGPAPLFYFVFITLATLRLSFWLPIFTGVLAAVEYVLCAYWVLAQPSPVAFPEELTAPLPYVFRGIILVAAGAVSGYVGRQIWHQMLTSFRTLEERNRVVSMFGQHVSPEVVERLLEQDLPGDGEERDVCVMFLDIRDFTTFSETRSPAEVVEYLNSLFVFMIDAVNRNDGIVNKFLGDGFMAVFGAPLSSGDDRRNAVRAALDITREVRRRAAEGSIPPTRIGIGLHAGAAVTGNVGSEQRKEYTIIGDVVNLASRVEQLNKQYGTEILASTDVLAVLPELQSRARDMGAVGVKGRHEPVRVHCLDDVATGPTGSYPLELRRE